jgi:hypothetical protein
MEMDVQVCVKYNKGSNVQLLMEKIYANSSVK